MSNVQVADVANELQEEVPPAIAKISHYKKRAFLRALCETPNIGVAAKAAEVSYAMVFYWKRVDPEFAEAFDVARDASIAHAEAEAIRRATEGVEEDVYGPLGQGLGSGVIGKKTVRSDTLLIFMLKAARPDVYRERFDHEVSGRGGGPIEIAEVRTVLVQPGQPVINVTPQRAIEDGSQDDK